MVGPFLWMLTTSLKDPSQVFSYSKNWWEEWIPMSFVWKNYLEPWKVVPFARFYLNSIFIAVSVTFAQVMTSSMAAYSFARLRFPGRDNFFLVILRR
jgi:multiple sugar transport system permease protein